MYKVIGRMTVEVAQKKVHWMMMRFKSLWKF